MLVIVHILSTFRVTIICCHHVSHSIKLCAEEKKLNKRKKMIDACCDANFTKAVTECCWNVMHGRAPLSTHKIQQLKRHKALLRKLSNSSILIKEKKMLFKKGADSRNYSLYYLVL